MRGCGTAARSAGDRPIRSSSTSAASTTACWEAPGLTAVMPASPHGDRGVRRSACPPPRRSTRPARPGPGTPPAAPGHPAAARSGAQRGRDHEVRLGGHGDHAARVAAGDDHARRNGESQPVPGLPAQRAGHGPVGDPARGIHPAEPVQHVIRDGRDFRRDGHGQAAGRGRPGVRPGAWPGPRGNEGSDERGDALRPMQRAQVTSARKPDLLVFQRPQSGNSTDVVVAELSARARRPKYQTPSLWREFEKVSEGGLEPPCPMRALAPQRRNVHLRKSR